MKHRCAVCWQEQPDHDGWFTHATEVHGAVLAEFGMRQCKRNPRDCVGVKRARTLRTEGSASRRATPVRNQPITTRDGTTYTPIPLPLEPR